MRILIIAYDYLPGLGGVAGCSIELAQALSSSPGVDVHVIAPASQDYKSDFNIDRARRFFTVRVRMSKRPELAILPLAWATHRVIRRWKPDLVIDTLWLPCGMATSLALSLSPGCRTKQGILVHAVEILEGTRTLRKWLRARLAFIKRAVFRRADFIFPVSTYTAELVRTQCGARPGQLVQIQNGVNLDRFYPAKTNFERKDFAAEGQKIIFTLARLEAYKGVDIMLAALAKLAKKNLRCQYLIGGTGPDRPRLERITRELGLDAQVRFLGKVPDSRLRDYYNLCDLFVLLSRIELQAPNVEGFGLVYLEAAACGKPSIAPNVGGPRDAVLDGKTGLHVNPEDPDAVAQALEKLLSSPPRLAELGQNALLRAREEYSWSRVASGLLRGIS
ncbi:MAG TPA: glycosyltransferase family 4 protein [Bdellovibrionota bacterium]|jgi:phosphatidylinositol alpha-1,6-mannosyltransferase